MNTRGEPGEGSRGAHILQYPSEIQVRPKNHWKTGAGCCCRIVRHCPAVTVRIQVAVVQIQMLFKFKFVVLHPRTCACVKNDGLIKGKVYRKKKLA